MAAGPARSFLGRRLFARSPQWDARSLENGGGLGKQREREMSWVVFLEPAIAHLDSFNWREKKKRRSSNLDLYDPFYLPTGNFIKWGVGASPDQGGLETKPSPSSPSGQSVLGGSRRGLMMCLLGFELPVTVRGPVL